MSDNKKLDLNELDKVSGGLTPNSAPFSSIWVDFDKCTCCGNCESVCINSAIHEDGGSYDVNPFACNGCGDCIDACPAGAIHRDW